MTSVAAPTATLPPPGWVDRTLRFELNSHEARVPPTKLHIRDRTTRFDRGERHRADRWLIGGAYRDPDRQADLTACARSVLYTRCRQSLPYLCQGMNRHDCILHGLRVQSATARLIGCLTPRDVYCLRPVSVRSPGRQAADESAVAQRRPGWIGTSARPTGVWPGGESGAGRQ